MKRKFLYLLLTLCLLGQCLPAFAAQAPVLERIAFSGATIVGQFKSDVYQYQLVLDNAAVMGAGLTSGRDRKVTSSVMPRVKRSLG